MLLNTDIDNTLTFQQFQFFIYITYTGKTHQHPHACSTVPVTNMSSGTSGVRRFTERSTLTSVTFTIIIVPVVDASQLLENFLTISALVSKTIMFRELIIYLHSSSANSVLLHNYQAVLKTSS